MLEQGNMTLSAESTPLAPDRQQLRQILRDCYALTKPNITFEILVTTFTGMWLASGGPPDWGLAFWTLLGVGLASGSSCAFNNYIDREIDKHMERTRNRPLPAGRLSPSVALVLGSVFGVLSFAVLLWKVNLITAGLTLFTGFYYVVIYTLWLKRNSPLNTSLGGVSGALPAVLGVTAVANQLTPVAFALFGIMYIWQPPHFWALALIKVEEYRKVGIPMLPVVKGEAITKRQMLLYTIALIPASTSLYWLNATGWIYLLTALILGAIYLGLTIDFIRKPVTRKRAYRLFFFSIIYLCLLFVMMFVNAVPA
jgi:protoheme IX farnesyltransferase